MKNNLQLNKSKKTNLKTQKDATVTLRDMLRIIAVILVATLTILFIALNFNTENTTVSIQDRYDNFINDWHIQVGDRDTFSDLPAAVKAKSTEHIYLSKELPTVLPYYAIATRNYHQELKAYVDDELIYSFPSEEDSFASSSVITDDWNIIPLDESMSGKTITLELITGKYGFDGSIQPVHLGEDNSLVQFLRAETAIPYSMAVSVLTLGIILMVLGIVYSKYNEDMSEIIAGLMLVAIGIWVTNRSKMPILLVGSSFKYYLAYFSLMIESVLILLYVSEKFKDRNRKFTNCLILAFTIYIATIFLIVHVLEYPLDQAVPFGYAAIFLSSVYLIYMLWPISFGSKKGNLAPFVIRANKIEFVATVIMVGGVCLGIVWDFIIGSNNLWTDIGTLPKISLNAYAIGQLLVHVYRSYRSVEEREELQDKLHDSQMELMMGQIQPHFIFNTLSSIRTLVKVDPDTAYDMIYDFSNYLRANVDNVTNMDGIRFAAEVEHINSYVNIEKVRFGDRVTVEQDIQVSDFLVPPLSIQPLVENAIKHGLTKKIGGGTVWLRSYATEKYNVVEVEDNGTGFTPEKLEEIRNSMEGIESDNSETAISLTGNGSEHHKSSGMRNIYLRLKEMADAEMEITSEEGVGTIIKVLFPK